jgi:CRP-like cAMP-binding protein
VQIVRPGLERVTLGIFGPREPIGLSAMLDRGVYPADAVAACDVEVARVPAALVLEAMESDNGFVRAINRGLVAHTRALQAKIEMLTAGEVSARLAMLIRHLSERFGDEDEHGRTFVPVVLSRGDLARLVGARSETVIRVMSRWQKAKLIETKADGFRILDAAALAEQ